MNALVSKNVGLPLGRRAACTVHHALQHRQLRPAICPGSKQLCQRDLRARVYNFEKNPDPADRLLAGLPYLLPLLDALPLGKYIFIQYPYVARAMAVLAPVQSVYYSIPFLPFIVFLGVYSGIVSNTNLSRFIRYNAMQAVLLDILLIIPQLLLDTVFHAPEGGLGLQAYVSSTNTVFLFVAICVAYGMGSCAVGQTPRLPLVAEAADSQVRDGPSGF